MTINYFQFGRSSEETLGEEIGAAVRKVRNTSCYYGIVCTRDDDTATMNALVAARAAYSDYLRLRKEINNE